MTSSVVITIIKVGQFEVRDLFARDWVGVASDFTTRTVWGTLSLLLLANKTPLKQSHSSIRLAQHRPSLTLSLVTTGYTDLSSFNRGVD